MKLTKAFLIILVTGAAVLAQGPPPGGGREFGHMGGGMPGGPEFGGPRGHKLITGAAYTADVNATQTRTLSDGNVIQHTMSGKVARDAAGRTYMMHTSTGGPLGQTGTVTRISIVDPVAGYSYELDTTKKTAVRREIHQPPAGAGDHANFRGANPNAQARPEDPNVVKKDLGSQMMNGVVAQGKSHTRTVPAGSNGNAKPIVSTSETWISPDLQVVVSATMNDPRVGTSAYALTNIQKTADPSLFQVPAGYTITDAPKGRGGPGGRMEHRPGPPPQE